MNLSVLTANWRTLLTSLGAALSSALTVLAALPAQIGELSTVIPEEYKAKIITAGLIATVLLRVLNGLFQKDANVSGNGSINHPTIVPTPEGGNKVAGL